MPAGTIVASGSLVSPGGQQGIPGQNLVSQGFVIQTAAYTLTTADNGKYVICSGGSWTLTLPAPATGLNYRVRNDMGISGTTGTITLSPTSGTIDGAATLPLLAGQEVFILTDGTNWRTSGRQREVIIGTQDITSSTASATVLLPSGYRFFKLIFARTSVSTSGATITAQISVDGGSTFQTGSNYLQQFLFNASTTAAGASNYTTTFFYLTANQSTNPYGIDETIFYPGDASAYPTIVGIASGFGGGNIQVQFAGCLFNQLIGTVNALKYSASSGNILTNQLTVIGSV